jgi:serine/threonine protein kinase HipA of HipAB toxin-antitoxin module
MQLKRAQRRNAHNAQRVKTIGRIMSTKTNETTNDVKTNDAKTPKTFKLAQLARDCQLNEKIVRSRFRSYHANDDAKYDVVRQTCKNAKSRWVRDDDE